MRGLKRKIDIVKKEDKDSRAVAFSKRRKGLYSKASELCLLSGAKIAILATPVSSNSYASFYSFGHSSVDDVVTAFLTDQRPREDLGLGFWWEDERLAKSEDLEELRGAIDSMTTLLNNLKEFQNRGDREDTKKKGLLQETHQMQTQDLQPSSPSHCCVNFDGVPENSNEGFLANIDGFDQPLDLYQMQTQDPQSSSASHYCVNFDGVPENNNNECFLANIDGFDEGLDLDQIIDFDFEAVSEDLFGVL